MVDSVLKDIDEELCDTIHGAKNIILFSRALFGCPRLISIYEKDGLRRK